MKLNKIFIPLLIGITVVVAFGLYMYDVQSKASNSEQTTSTQNIRKRTQPTSQQETNTETTEFELDSGSATTQETAEYLNYSPTAVAAKLAENKTVVLFFHAGWCPTCKAADVEIKQDISQLPENLVIFKTDYDTQEELKEKYSVTYQHTFVQIDDNLEEIVSWNGGAVSEINSRIQN